MRVHNPVTASRTCKDGRARGIAISIGGKGQWRDNVFIKQLWKSVKYEDIYLNSYGSIAEFKKGPLNTSCFTTKSNGTRVLTEKPRLWFPSTRTHGDRSEA